MKRYSEQEKTDILERLAASGKSRAAFCRDEGLCYATVGNWLGRELSASQGACKTSALTLLELDSSGQTDSTSGVRVEVGGGVSIHFESSVSPSALAQFCREVVSC